MKQFQSLTDSLFQKLDEEQLKKLNGGRTADTCQTTAVTTASNPNEGDPAEEDDDIASSVAISATRQP